MKQRTKVITMLVTAPIALIAFIVADHLLPDPAIRVAPETTWITSPLTANGAPDYGTHLENLRKSGVTPENNAAVLLWQAMWPGGLEAEHQRPFCDALGMPVPDPQASLWEHEEILTERLAESLASRPADTGDEEWIGEIEEIIDQTCSRPWTREELPVLAEWMESHQAALDLLVEAAGRSHNWSPQPERLAGRHVTLAFSNVTPEYQVRRQACRHLCRRAMWHIGEGRPIDAWRDISALYQFAHHLGQGLVADLVVRVPVPPVTLSESTIPTEQVPK